MEKEYWIFKIESKHREIDSNVLLIFQEIERERGFRFLEQERSGRESRSGRRVPKTNL